MEEDLEKIKEFCSKALNDEEYYESLKALSGISDETREILTKVCLDYLFGQEYNFKANPITNNSKVELISRYLNPNPFLKSTIKKVEGPISIYQLSHKKYPHIFYLFGDFHENMGKCKKEPKVVNVDLLNFIRATIRSSPVFTDIYLEMPHKYKDYPYFSPTKHHSGDYIISNIYRFYKECFKEKANSIKCFTSRFHAIDMRNFFETEEQKNGYYLFQKFTFKHSSQLKNVNLYIEFLKNKNSLVYQRIKKQIMNVSYPEIKSLLQNKYEEIIQNSKKIRFIKSKEVLLGEDSLTVLSNRERFGYFQITNFKLDLMDLYFLARAFRSYEKKTTGYNFQSYNNIVIAGDVHIGNYVKFLTDLGFNIDYKNINFSIEMSLKYFGKTKYVTKKKMREIFLTVPNFQCIDISEMKQPMFHQRYKV